MSVLVLANSTACVGGGNHEIELLEEVDPQYRIRYVCQEETVYKSGLTEEESELFKTPGFDGGAAH